MQAMKLIAGDDWVPMRERQKAAQKNAQDATAARYKDVTNDALETSDGAIDPMTYGLEEEGEDSM